MALLDNEFFVTVSTETQKRIWPEHQHDVTFAAATGTLKVGYAVAFDSSVGHWKPWTDSAANGVGDIRGIVYPADITLAAANEVQGAIMLTGTVHRDDILSAESDANVDAECRANLRDRGIIVDGLDQVH